MRTQSHSSARLAAVWHSLQHAFIERERLVFGALALCLAFYLHWRSPNVTDSDAFYHWKHAQIYVQEGLWTSEFPWANYSVIRLDAVDLWYGFHIVLMPFTLFSDNVLGLKMAGVAVTWAMLLLSYGAFRRAGVIVPFLWPLVLLLASANELWRMLMLRPHVLTVGLLLWLWLALHEDNRRLAFACAAAMAWLHLTTIWLLAPMLLFVLGGQAWVRQPVRSWPWKACLATLPGVLLGWFLRPGAWNALDLMRVQIIEWSRLKSQGVPLGFGTETEPMNLELFWANAVFFLALWVGSFLVALWRRRKGAPFSASWRERLCSSVVLSLLFVEMTLVIARRSADFWYCFATLSTAICVTLLMNEATERRAANVEEDSTVRTKTSASALAPRLMSPVIGVLMLLMVWRSLDWNARAMTLAIAPRRLEGAATWLKDNSKPGSIVFHTDWTMFGELFFWNSHNTYIGGMDPIFQYSYDPALFWKAAHYNNRVAVAVTSGQPPALNGGLLPPFEPTHAVLRRDFKASYLILVKPLTPELFAFAQTDKGFVKSYEDAQVVIFRLD